MNDTAWKLGEYAWQVGGALIAVVWWLLHSKIDTQKTHLEEKLDTHKTTLEKQIEASNIALGKRIDECNGESDTQRGHIAKIFDKLEENNKDSQKRHNELLTAIYTGLAGKADK